MKAMEYKNTKHSLKSTKNITSNIKNSREIILRYLSLYRHFIKNSLQVFMTHRFNLLMSIGANLAWTVAQLISLRILFDKIPQIQGWSEADLVLLLALGQIYVYVEYVVYGGNLNQVGEKIRLGELDQILLKPVNEKFMISFRYVSLPQLIAAFIATTPLLVYSFANQTTLLPEDIAGSIVILLLGLILIYFFRLAFEALNFFFKQTDSLRNTIFFNLRDLTRIPLEIFPKALKGLLTFIRAE